LFHGRAASARRGPRVADEPQPDGAKLRAQDMGRRGGRLALNQASFPHLAQQRDNRGGSMISAPRRGRPTPGISTPRGAVVRADGRAFAFGRSHDKGDVPLSNDAASPSGAQAVSRRGVFSQQQKAGLEATEAVDRGEDARENRFGLVGRERGEALRPWFGGRVALAPHVPARSKRLGVFAQRSQHLDNADGFQFGPPADIHARRFVQHEEVLIFVKNGQQAREESVVHGRALVTIS
jgi:hypothetical protein